MLSRVGVVVRRAICGVLSVLWVVPCVVSAQSRVNAVHVTDAYVPTMTFDVASVRESKRNPQRFG